MSEAAGKDALEKRDGGLAGGTVGRGDGDRGPGEAGDSAPVTWWNEPVASVRFLTDRAE
jgi:hypothetical protein